MSDSHTGNVQPQLDLEEHHGTAQAKRVILFGLDPDTGQFVAPTVFDYSSANPLAVVLTHPGTGTAYSATAAGAGGSGGNVTAHIANPLVTVHLFSTSITLPVNITNPTVTVNVSNTVTVALFAAAVTVRIFSSNVTLNNNITNPLLTARLFENRSTFPTATFIWISDAAGLLAASNATRSTLIIQNDFDASHSLFVGPYTVDLDIYGMELRAGGVYRDVGPVVYNGNVFGVLLTTATTATVRARVLETH